MRPTQKGGHDRRIGRSRGGLTTKIHAVVDVRGLPLRFGLTPGQAHDTALVDELLGNLVSDTVVIADKAYDANSVRHRIEQQGPAPNIPDRRNRKDRHGFSRTLYRTRNRIERFFNRIKHLRRIATRYEKRAANYLAMLKLAAIRVWLRFFESMAYAPEVKVENLVAAILVFPIKCIFQWNISQSAMS